MQLAEQTVAPPAPPPPPPPPPSPPPGLVVAISPAEQNVYNADPAGQGNTFFWAAVIMTGVGPYTYSWSTGSTSSNAYNTGVKPAGQAAVGGSVSVTVHDFGLSETSSASANWAISEGGPPS